MINRMEEVAKMFGLELRETFKIADDIFGEHPKYYRFAENVCLEASNDGAKWDTADAGVLEDILMGDVRIIKLPWKPQKGEKYYVPSIVIRPEDRNYYYYWSNDDINIEHYRMGIVCKTPEEATALTEKMLVAINEQ